MFKPADHGVSMLVQFRGTKYSKSWCSDFVSRFCPSISISVIQNCKSLLQNNSSCDDYSESIFE